ncbi:glycosyltransferase family 2 protein [Candidatus Woesearchaeota archaeon]|nr:MAG: glycosyltransferase family 2 protein [Candidatus Woesearchaeota archaeon]
MKTYDLSILIPTYNRKKCILHAVQSVLQQRSSGLTHEIIIIDDGSTDKTYELFAKNRYPHLRYFYYKQNKGVNAARNRGVEKALGKYILLLDSDDRLTKDCFEVIAQYTDRNHKKMVPLMLFGTQEIKSGKLLSHIQEEKVYSYREWLEAKKVYGEFLMVIRTDLLRKNPFPEEFFCFEQYHWGRLIQKNRVFASKKILRLYSYEQENRVSKKLLEPSNAEKRFRDYQKYLATFGKDYLRLSLKEKYADLLFKQGFYGILSGKKESKALLKKSLAQRFSVFVFLVFLASFLGKNAFLRIYALFLKTSFFEKMTTTPV